MTNDKDDKDDESVTDKVCCLEKKDAGIVQHSMAWFGMLWCVGEWYSAFSHHYQGSIDFNTVNIHRTAGPRVQGCIS